MRYAIITLLALFSTHLAGCHSSSVQVAATTEYYYEDDSPRIRTFGLVDSYSNDSEYSSHGSLALDPFMDYGIFEVYWDVSSFYDYTVAIYVNDRPNLDGAILVGEDYCGPFEACENAGMQVCEYSPDFYIGCGLDLNDAERFARSIDVLLGQVPDRAYLSLEVCPTDGGFCEVQSIPVTLY